MMLQFLQMYFYKRFPKLPYVPKNGVNVNIFGENSVESDVAIFINITNTTVIQSQLVIVVNNTDSSMILSNVKLFTNINGSDIGIHSIEHLDKLSRARRGTAATYMSLCLF